MLETVDISKNPNADTERRIKAMKALGNELAGVLQKHSVEIAKYAEDVPHFYSSLMQTVFIQVLTIQAATEEDKTMTVKDHMTNQFIAGKMAYADLAKKNAAILDLPAKMERRK